METDREGETETKSEKHETSLQPSLHIENPKGDVTDFF
jgi:hypothetical protein